MIKTISIFLLLNLSLFAQVSRGSITSVSPSSLPDSVVMENEIFNNGDFFVNRASDSLEAFKITSLGNSYFNYNLGVGTATPTARLHLFNTGIITDESGFILENENIFSKYQFILSSDFGLDASGVAIYEPNLNKSLIEFNWGETATSQSYITLYNQAGDKYYLKVNNDSTLTLTKLKP